MPVINVKVEGTTKMIKSVLVNVEDVCQAIGRPVECKIPDSKPTLLLLDCFYKHGFSFAISCRFLICSGTQVYYLGVLVQVLFNVQISGSVSSNLK